MAARYVAARQLRSVTICTLRRGIDKPDVRFVGHYDSPKCLEEFAWVSGACQRSRLVEQVPCNKCNRNRLFSGRQGISDCIENVMTAFSCPKQVAHRMQGSGRGRRDGHKCVSIIFSDQEHLAWLQKVETHPRGTRHHSTSDQSPTLQCMLLIMQAGQV